MIDCDGVLTDNKVWYDNNGNRTKGFNSSDVWAIRELISMGYYVIIWTASTWPGLEQYAKRTGADIRIQRDKGGLEDYDFICVINDVFDKPLYDSAIRSYCPSDAYIKGWKHINPLKTKGGEGVIAELVKILDKERRF